MADARIDASAFDRLSTDAATALLRPVCASDAWISALVADRPYGALAAAQVRSDEVLARLGWPDIEQAMAAHPRIGERPTGGGTEAGWSRQEQAAATGGADQLRAGNVEYEQRFGHVFLICATGLSSDDILTALRARLGNDAAAERAVVREELAKIVRLRLAKTLS
jgi:2-oxo-4-hydroxy-4-carboxy-5-ureidoimidazoline decarboxylase